MTMFEKNKLLNTWAPPAPQSPTLVHDLGAGMKYNIFDVFHLRKQTTFGIKNEIDLSLKLNDV